MNPPGVFTKILFVTDDDLLARVFFNGKHSLGHVVFAYLVLINIPQARLDANSNFFIRHIAYDTLCVA